MPPRELTDVTVCLHAETDKAVLVSDAGHTKDAAWLPKSQIEIERTNRYTTAGDQINAKRYPVIVVTLPEWLAINKGLA